MTGFRGTFVTTSGEAILGLCAIDPAPPHLGIRAHVLGMEAMITPEDHPHRKQQNRHQNERYNYQYRHIELQFDCKYSKNF